MAGDLCMGPTREDRRTRAGARESLGDPFLAKNKDFCKELSTKIETTTVVLTKMRKFSLSIDAILNLRQFLLKDKIIRNYFPPCSSLFPDLFLCLCPKIRVILVSFQRSIWQAGKRKKVKNAFKECTKQKILPQMPTFDKKIYVAFFCYLNV